MTFRELLGLIFGIVFIVGGGILFSFWVISQDEVRREKFAKEKQRIEQIEEENRLLKSKCSVGTLTWQMEQAK